MSSLCSSTSTTSQLSPFARACRQSWASSRSGCTRSFPSRTSRSPGIAPLFPPQGAVAWVQERQSGRRSYACSRRVLLSTLYRVLADSENHGHAVPGCDPQREHDREVDHRELPFPATCHHARGLDLFVRAQCASSPSTDETGKARRAMSAGWRIDRCSCRAPPPRRSATREGQSAKPPVRSVCSATPRGIHFVRVRPLGPEQQASRRR